MIFLNYVKSYTCPNYISPKIQKATKYLGVTSFRFIKLVVYSNRVL